MQTATCLLTCPHLCGFEFSLGTGALQLDAIDTTTSSDSIKDFLAHTIHAQPGCTDVADLMEPPPQCAPDQCSSHPDSGGTKALVKMLHHQLVDRRVKPGAFMSLTTASVEESFAYILGVTQKRPLVQTAVHATLHGNGDVVIKCHDGVPQVSTSYQILQELLSKSPSGEKAIVHVTLWTCKVRWCGRALIACVDSIRSEFEVGHGIQLPKRTASTVQLPFGLRVPRKRRKKTVTPGTSTKTKTSKKADPDPEGSQESSSEVEKAAAEEAEVEVDINAESNPIEPISETMAAEEVAAASLAREIDAADQRRSELADQVRSGTVSTPKGSYFSQFVGIDCGALAASGRSICLHCKQAIPKGDVRFSWFHSRLRPSAWVHAHCVFQLAKASGLTDQVTGRLEEIIGRSTSSTSSQNQIQAEASSILRMLKPRPE